MKLSSYGGNPDAAPWSAFTFDAWCGTTGNFLFIDTSSFAAVAAIIGADAIENFALTWSCVSSLNAELGASGRPGGQQRPAPESCFASRQPHWPKLSGGHDACTHASQLLWFCASSSWQHSAHTEQALPVRHL